MCRKERNQQPARAGTQSPRGPVVRAAATEEESYQHMCVRPCLVSPGVLLLEAAEALLSGGWGYAPQLNLPVGGNGARCSAPSPTGRCPLRVPLPCVRHACMARSAIAR